MKTPKACTRFPVDSAVMVAQAARRVDGAGSTVPFYPVLFAAYPVLRLYAANVTEVDLTDGSSQVISRFAVSKRDDLAVGDVQLATALLTEAAIRHSTDPDRGQWPTWAIVASQGCLIPVVALALLWWVRRRKAPA